jgi:Lon protease-like protein
MLDCATGEPEFGVVLIERGHEVGGGDTRFKTGTVARIRQAGELPDGRWFLTVVGTGRFRVSQWLPEDPYPLAMVEDLLEPPWPPDAAPQLAAAEARVRRALELASELGGDLAGAASGSVPELGADPSVAAWQLAALAPLGPLDRQRLLETANHSERLTLLSSMAEAEAEMLAYRLASG